MSYEFRIQVFSFCMHAFNTEEEYTCKTATNANEAKELIEHDFEYIQEIDGLRLYRKRK